MKTFEIIAILRMYKYIIIDVNPITNEIVVAKNSATINGIEKTGIELSIVCGDIGYALYKVFEKIK